MDKRTQFAISFANAALSGDNAVAGMVEALAGTQPDEILALMHEVAKAYCTLPQYKGTTLGPVKEYGRPNLVHTEYENKIAPAQQIFNLFWSKVDEGLGGKVVPGCRAKKAKKSSKKVSHMQRLLADAMRLLEWDEYEEMARLMAANVAAHKRGEL